MYLKLTKLRCSTKTACFILLSMYVVLLVRKILYRIHRKRLIADKIFLNKNSYKSITNNTKFILFWEKDEVFTQEFLENLNCPISDCVFSENRNLINDDYSQFDAVIFKERFLNVESGMPTKRRPHQLYIFFTLESAYNYPACEVRNDNYYNWSFTYRLDSDIPWYYFVVRDLQGDVVAPSLNARWDESTKPIKRNLKNILKRKTKPMAWLVSHCSADSFRDDYLSLLQEHMFHYSLKIDVYGVCSGLKCTNGNCDEMLRNDYYFYAAFENSFSEDYVTEKVLHGYNNYAVPIVYGAANYSRFLPPNSYINARKYHPYNLAYKIYEAMKDFEIYESYFKWTNTYTISENQGQDHPFCNLCGNLHSYKALRVPAKKKFRVWWNGLNGMKWCLSASYWNETGLLNIDLQHIFAIY